jgi:hypothetical protein
MVKNIIDNYASWVWECVSKKPNIVSMSFHYYNHEQLHDLSVKWLNVSVNKSFKIKATQHR